MSKKNKISEQEVKKIAELSRLSLTNEELKKRTEDMNNILDYMDTLNEIDTENVEELYNVHDMNNSLREDNYESSLDKKDVLANCLLYTSPSPRDSCASRMPSSA